MIKKGEIRTIVNPKNIRLKLEKLKAKRIKISKGRDVYFDKELFKRGYHLRIRKQMISYPQKEEQYSLTLKRHYSAFKTMNVYTNWTTIVDNTKTTRNLLRQLSHKEIFVELWNNCEEFEVNGVKLELFYLKGWDWLIEIESIIKRSKKKVYKKLLDTLALFNLNEKDLIITEPAEYLFNKKFK